MEQTEYIDFLKNKIQLHKDSGFEVERASLPDTLLPHAKDSVVWACAKGCAAVFSSFGMTKTRTNIAILQQVQQRRPHQPVLVIAPLGVKSQFQTEDGPAMGVTFEYVTNREEQHNATSDFHITNYERIQDGEFDFSIYSTIALDEGAKLRNISSNTTQALLQFAKLVEFKFVFTAMPSPNDLIELLNYAEFLGVMDRGQAKTRFFTRDSEKADNLTLDPNSELDFWLWVHSWALFLEKPSDLGYSDEGYDLPEIKINWHEIPVQTDAIADLKNKDGQYRLMPDATNSLVDEARIKKATVGERVQRAKEIVASNPDDNFLLWHLLEDERKAIEQHFEGVVSIYGSLTIDEKESRIADFSHGRTKYLAPKPEICGAGCNFQRHCHRAIYISIDHRFHDFLQSVYRIYRFLQKKQVEIDIIYSAAEVHIADDIKEKWATDKLLRAKMTELIRTFGLSHQSTINAIVRSFGIERKEFNGTNFTAINNDTVLELQNTASNRFGLVLTSIPFSNQYEYANSYNDFGHNLDNKGFFKQMDYLLPKGLDTLQPGRICAVHVKDRIVFGNFSGLSFPTLYPFSDDVISAFCKHGFHLMTRITIVTDVVRENNQTYRLGWTEVCKDGTKMGAGVPEYLLIFRKAPTDRSNGYADEPVVKNKSVYTRAQWQIDANSFWRSSGDRLLTPQEIASLDLKTAMAYFNNWTFREPYDYKSHVAIAEALEAAKKLPTKFAAVAPQSWNEEVWTDITRMRTLNTSQGQRREQQHLCPLPIDICERVIHRYSNEGDEVADWFDGMGTTSVTALKMGRKAWGCELSTDYWKIGVSYKTAAEYKQTVPTLFDAFGINNSLINQTA